MSKGKKRGCLVPVLAGLVVVLLLGIGIYWWMNRPIEPVVLSDAEKVELEEKVEGVQGEGYVAGKREIVFTQRELNGLLNEKTSYGDQVKFDLVTDAVNARIDTDLDDGLPVVGGRRLRAKARFVVKDGGGGTPELVLDDVTVWGVSMPNDWLAGMKGKNLLGEVFGGGSGGGLAGVESLRVEAGRLVIRLKE